MLNVVYKCRFWRADNILRKDTTAKDDCISSQTNKCIELNALMYVVLYRNCRDENKMYILNFLMLMGSQACEELFRKLRALTTAYWTAINFSVQEVLQKIRRINVLQQVEFELSKERKYFTN